MCRALTFIWGSIALASHCRRGPIKRTPRGQWIRSTSNDGEPARATSSPLLPSSAITSRRFRLWVCRASTPLIVLRGRSVALCGRGLLIYPRVGIIWRFLRSWIVTCLVFGCRVGWWVWMLVGVNWSDLGMMVFVDGLCVKMVGDCFVEDSIEFFSNTLL